MEITWSLYDCEGHESVAVALSHRYRQLVGEVREKIEYGEEKIPPVLTAGAKMELFMSHFDDYGAGVKDSQPGCEFDLPPPESINSALCSRFSRSSISISRWQIVIGEFRGR